MKILFALLALLLITHVSSAEIMPTACEDWYVFGSVEMSVWPQKFDYLPGEMVAFTGTLENTNPFPLTEGRIRMQVFYQERPNVDYMLDEFFISKNIYLKPGESREFGGFWDIPDNAKAGKYLIEAYYVIDEFNMAGVSFLRGLMGATTTIAVHGGTDLVYMNVSDILVNGEDASLREQQLIHEADAPINVTVPLVNEGPKTTATVSYMLYSWDDLREDSLQSQETQTVDLGADSSRKLEFETDGLPPGAYLLKIAIETDKNDNILKLRLPVEGKRVKMNFLGVDNFPIKVGDDVMVFLCASNSASYLNSTVTDVSVALLDEAGNTIFTDSLEASDVTSQPLGYVTSFKADKDYNHLVVSSLLMDESGTEEADLVYKVATPGCVRETKVCPDGTLVIRLPPACVFPQCPEVSVPQPPLPPVEQNPEQDNSLLLILFVLIILAAIAVYYKRR